MAAPNMNGRLHLTDDHQNSLTSFQNRPIHKGGRLLLLGNLDVHMYIARCTYHFV